MKTAHDLRARWDKLTALAQNQAGTPEGESAQRLADAMIERFPGLELLDVEPAELVVAFRHDFDRTILGHIALFLGLETFRVGRRRKDGKGVRWRDALELRGPAELTELAASFYKDQRAHLDELLHWTAVGYAAGAFPLDPSDDDDDDDDREPLDPALLEAAMAARTLGSRNRQTKPVPEDHRLT